MMIVMHASLEYSAMLHCYSYFLYWCSFDELQRLLKDKEAYNVFFDSLNQVKTALNPLPLTPSVVRTVRFYDWTVSGHWMHVNLCFV